MYAQSRDTRITEHTRYRTKTFKHKKSHTHNTQKAKMMSNMDSTKIKSRVHPGAHEG